MSRLKKRALLPAFLLVGLVLQHPSANAAPTFTRSRPPARRKGLARSSAGSAGATNVSYDGDADPPYEPASPARTCAVSVPRGMRDMSSGTPAAGNVP